MPDDQLLRIGAEFDISQIVAGSAEASAAVENLANNVAKSSEEMAGTSARAATAMEREAAAHIEAASAGRAHAEANLQARLTTDALTGNISRAENALIRFASHSEALGPIMQAAFAPLAVAIFADIVVHAAEKVYELYQNVVLLKGWIEALDKANEKEAESAARFNETYEEGLARRLEAEGNFAAARDAFRKAAADKPLELPKIDDKLFKTFNAEFISFLQAVHTSADAPSVITRINKEAEATAKQLADAKSQLNSLSEDTGEAAAYGGQTASIEHAQQLVDGLAQKYEFLKTVIGEVQSQTGSTALSLEGSLEGVAKKEEETARKIQEAQYAAMQALNEQQELAAKGAEAELRQIEETARKKEEAERKVFEDAWREYDVTVQVQEEITKEVEAEIKKREDLRRQEAEIDATIQARIDEQAKQSAAKAAEEQKRQMESVSRAITQGVDGPLKRMIEGTERVSLAFRQMAQNMVIHVIESFEKMLIQQAVHEAQMLLLHVITNQKKVASDAAAAQETKSISAASSLKEVVHAAAAAAAKAYEALAGIPVVGPALGAGAAAATFAGVMAFESMAAAEQGAYVPRNMPIYAHAGEMILPRNISDSVKAMADSGTGGGHTINVNWNAFDSKSLKDFLHQPGNRSQFTKALRNSVRNGVRFK